MEWVKNYILRQSFLEVLVANRHFLNGLWLYLYVIDDVAQSKRLPESFFL